SGSIACGGGWVGACSCPPPATDGVGRAGDGDAETIAFVDDLVADAVGGEQPGVAEGGQLLGHSTAIAARPLGHSPSTVVGDAAGRIDQVGCQGRFSTSTTPARQR